MNVIRVRSFLWVMSLSLALQGCAGIYSVVEFEVLEPATVSFPENVNQLVFLNRAPLSIDCWAEQNQVGMDGRELVLLDTLIINNLFRGVLDVLRSSPVERFHTPIWLAERRLDTALLSDRILTRREVDNICDTIGGDAIVSLELYFVSLDQHFDFYSDNPDEILNQYFEVSNRIVWNIHLPENPRPFDIYSTVDTLYFPVIENGILTHNIPGVELIRDLFYWSGNKYGTYLVPVWNKTSRMIYSGRGDSLRQAVKLTNAGNWEEALSIWDQLTLSDDSTLAAKAYHNMAVYFEMEDNLDSASILVDLSLEQDTLELDRLYREELDIRLLNRTDIEKQVR